MAPFGSPSRSTTQRPAPSGSTNEKHLHRAAGLPPQREPRRDDLRVVDYHEPILDEVRELGEDPVLDDARLLAIDEEPRLVPPLRGSLCDELRGKVVVELVRVHSARRVASPPMDALALERAKQRIADAAAWRTEPADIAAAIRKVAKA